MKIQLRLFSSIREAVNVSTEEVEVPVEVKTVEDVRQWLRMRGEPWISTFAPEKLIRAALNHEMVPFETPIEANAEVAFFPPVTGG